MIFDQVDVDTEPEDAWSPARGASINFERYIRRVVFKTDLLSSRVGHGRGRPAFSLVSLAARVFGLFRSWHNERSLGSRFTVGAFERLPLFTLRSHIFLLLTRNQSPFNVGTKKLELRDFTIAQTADLNSRYVAHH
jgi:hypothetical protein